MLGGFRISWANQLLRRVSVPIIKKDLLVIRRGRGDVDDDSGVAIAQDAFPRPVHARNDHYLVIEYESFAFLPRAFLLDKFKHLF